ncbi:hypothetical protein [Dictyobacter arantiisoli]|uniref:Protein kinase domain-containing protein n=1 Tax=Dictyobacter arantiisoli TaxID=2014874 RepID=A0A5A5TGU6_9CHLR|nr:hypothetical protein [Dictyobacter arantiisoli]GCF10249.1 hypothetical protein KDI_38130 [Dictyobacter arantiisoli]
MPDRLAYDEAMLFAATRLRIADPELKQGKVEVVTSQTALGTVERPWGIEGGFAVVYKFRTRSGKMRALRCFRVPMNATMRFRYERMGPFFQRHASAITVGCSYHDASIMVKEQGKSTAQAYPVIDMEWIDGLTLLEQVDVFCRQRDTASLRQLIQQWLYLVSCMQRCGMAHGDLAAVNIMVRPDHSLVLVDYDGVYLPEFGPTAAHLDRVLLGQADYQHPQMSERTFNASMDAFSALVIYTALSALAVHPELWDTYMKRDQQDKLLDTNLLFTRQDFKEPRQSQLFHELLRLDNAQVTDAIHALQQACLQDVNQVRFPLQFIEQAPSLHDGTLVYPTTSNVRRDSVLSSLAVADSHDIHHTAPRQSVASIQRSHTASSSLYPIASGVPGVSRAVTERAVSVRQMDEQIKQLSQVCQSEDDEAIAAAYEEISNFGHFDAQALPEALLERARLAQRRRSALARFRIALSNKRPLQIATAYDDRLLNNCQNVTPRERSLLARARAFQRAYQERIASALIDAYEAIQQSIPARTFLFSAQELEDVQTARAYLSMYQRVEHACASEDEQAIRAAYDATLAQAFSDFTASQRQRIACALQSVEIEQALASKAYERALLASNALPEAVRPYISTFNAFKLQKAALRFVRQHDLTALTVELIQQAGRPQLLVRWRWPATELIQHAVIVWSNAGYPPHLANHVQRATLGKTTCWVQRQGQEQGQCMLPFEAAEHIYVHGYSALLDVWEDKERWFFADGSDPTSQGVL